MLTHATPSASSAHLLSLEAIRAGDDMARASLRIEDWRSLLGAAIDQAFRVVGWSRKEAAAALDRDPAQIARWIHGTERPQFDTLFAVEALRAPLVIALARLTEGCDVTTHISISMRRTA